MGVTGYVGSERTVVVVGGGPGGLLAAEQLAAAGLRVTLIERGAAIGRKLLVAGRSGLNLTNAEPLDELLDRFGPDRAWLEPAIRAWGPTELRDWVASLGLSTFVGTSRKVFPSDMGAVKLLQAWRSRLDQLGVTIRTRLTWTGWNDSGGLLAQARDGSTTVFRPDATVLALGGASWPKTGSDGGWATHLARTGIRLEPFSASNAAMEVHWTAGFVDRFAGVPLKNVALTIGDHSARGDVVVTRSGLEGGAVYAVGRAARTQLVGGVGKVTLLVNLCPDVPVNRIVGRLAFRRQGETTTRWLARLGGLSPVAIGLVREATANDVPADPVATGRLLTGVPLPVVGLASVERAISTAGGVPRSEVDDRFMLRSLPGVFVVGEMLAWDAPTGGYLVQATCSTAVAAAAGARAWIERPTGGAG